MSKKTMLIIMDGWGIGDGSFSDAITAAKKPFYDSLYQKYAHAKLQASGEAVGLPAGQMGNSEVGHMNLGAGRIVPQEFKRITEAINNGQFANNRALNEILSYVKEKNVMLHFVGLASDGGVHSHIDHLKALCDLAQKNHVPKFAIHMFSDGRDTDPESEQKFVKETQDFLKGTNGFIATIVGRFYAMDRDSRWERISIDYNAMVNGVGIKATDPIRAINASYNSGLTDEFIKPIILCDDNGNPLAKIKDGDAVICFNFRTDRCREITEALTQKEFPQFSMRPLRLEYATMTEYDKTYKNIKVLFENPDIKNTLGEVFSKFGKTQLRIAETEKYPHVTFFFSGGREEPFPGEKRIMIPSVCTVETYDQKCEMCACEITDAIIPEIKSEQNDFICMNLANADMVGHTGVWTAIIGAIETIDACLSRIIPLALENNYSVFLTADHGNAEYARNSDGSPNTAHTTNLVPLFLIDNEFQGKLRDGKLGDVAPTILKYANIEIPKEMTGNILIE